MNSVTLTLAALIACSYGQTCLKPSPNDPTICCEDATTSDDNPADECLTPDDTILSFIDTGICNENFDCCTCTGIIVDDARSFICGGDSGCIAVPINLNGNSLGASLKCNGDFSCFRSVITGNNILSIGCDGDMACRGTDMTLNFGLDFNKELAGLNFPCNGDSTCRESKIVANNVGGIQCNGDFSCMDCELDFICKTNDIDVGCPIIIGGDSGMSETTLKAVSASKLQCGGDGACEGTTFDITCVPNGCPVNCNGDDSCEDSNWNLVNVNLIECVGDGACEDSTIIALCTSQFGCPIRCSAESPCSNARFTITNSQGLLCSGLGSACSKAVFKLINNIDGKINCLGSNGCFMATINGGNTQTPVINIKEVLCSGNLACKDASIYIECDDGNGCPVLCSGNNVCDNNNIDIIQIDNAKTVTCTGNAIGTTACSGVMKFTTLDNSFTFICGAAQSCQNGVYTIDTNDDITSISCIGASGCQNTNMNIINDGETTLVIKSYNCGGLLSCANGLISISNVDINKNNLQIDLFGCTGKESCSNANIVFNAEKVEAVVKCTGELSCKGLIIDVTNVNDCAGLIVECSIVNLVDTCLDGQIRNGVNTQPLDNFDCNALLLLGPNGEDNGNNGNNGNN